VYALRWALCSLSPRDSRLPLRACIAATARGAPFTTPAYCLSHFSRDLSFSPPQGALILTTLLPFSRHDSTSSNLATAHTSSSSSSSSSTIFDLSRPWPRPLSARDRAQTSNPCLHRIHGRGRMSVQASWQPAHHHSSTRAVSLLRLEVQDHGTHKTHFATVLIGTSANMSSALH
jgi:hypothetical protein